MKYKVIKSFPGNLSVGDEVHIEYPRIRYTKEGVEYNIGIITRDIPEYFEKVSERPMSFSEIVTVSGYYVSSDSYIKPISTTDELVRRHGINTRPIKGMAEAQLALSQLMQLRDAWRDGYTPRSIDETRYVIWGDDLPIYSLSFDSEVTKDLFQETFKDLIEKIKPLYFS